MRHGYVPRQFYRVTSGLIFNDMMTTYNITGMHCASCKELIEEVCCELPGVQSCIVDASTGVAQVEHGGSFTMSSFQEAIAHLGDYTVKEI